MINEKQYGIILSLRIKSLNRVKTTIKIFSFDIIRKL